MVSAVLSKMGRMRKATDAPSARCVTPWHVLIPRLRNVHLGAEYMATSPCSDCSGDQCHVVDLLGDGWVLVSFEDGERCWFFLGGFGEVPEPVPQGGLG